MPVLIVLVLLPMQFALWWHANQAAEVAAEEAVQAAVVLGADPRAAAVEGVEAILGQAGNVEGVSIQVETSSNSVTVRVTGDLAFSVIPLSVSAQASGRLERFVPEDERS